MYFIDQIRFENPLSIGFNWDSFEDRKFYDLAFSDDAVDITEEKELQEFLSNINAIHMLTGHLGDASTRLSDDNFPLTKNGEHKDKRSFVDGLKLEESKEVQALLCNGIHLPRGHLPQLKNRQHIEKKVLRGQHCFSSLCQNSMILAFS